MTAIDDEDARLFRLAMRDVRPRPPSPRVADPGRRPEPRAHQREADDLEVLREMLLDPDPGLLEHGETLHYRAPGVQEAVLRRLRRGHYHIERVLDLHGHNRDQARHAIVRFLAECRQRDIRCVRIIHGKGHGSPNSGPVLKRLLDGWLRQRRDVLAFCSARPVDGGSGALYVLLRSG
ncbi:DNA-nicking endonuclease, Smr domain [Fontimonas thermophila]|uniref:DNA-nicking endonuclease, Smr domain n=1 Tax=Fontimonas thermophila TaxID=1076937 RepID=A0A1I2IR78_9GAMM|nr:Smr/MutS family protein [Fontimonas thermophila]SFF44825.1 DNA-nicking endonuclease, Smr domain [Fontimonas thermophila]